MGSEFDNNGLYSGWSPLFDRTSLTTLNASLKLPTPNNTELYLNREGKGTDITELIKEVARLRTIQEEIQIDYNISELGEFNEALSNYEQNTVNFLNAFIELLKVTQNSSSVYSNASASENKLAIGLLNRHNKYFTSSKEVKNKKVLQDRINQGLKNSVSSKIMGVIHNLKNAVAATTPINMDTPQDAAKKSALGLESVRITSLSPSSIWKMVVQNMDGRAVIGIAATGEKIFFANCFYFNEILKNGNIAENLDRLTFGKKYKKLTKIPKVIDGKIQLDEQGNVIYERIDTVRNILSNINFKLLQDPKDKEIIKGLIEKFADKNGLSEIEKAKAVQDQLGLQEDQSLVISALLSAATDNAKELILSKINAGPNLAGIYLHLIMLGFDFDDISDFMTSEVVQTINDLAKSNIFDEYNSGTKGSVISRVINTIKYGPQPENYLKSKDILDLWYFASKAQLIDKNEVNQDELVPFLVKSVYEGSLKISTIKSIIPEGISNAFRFNRFFRDLGYFSSINTTLSTGENAEIFDQFIELRNDASETTTLGQAYGINQGMKTNLAQRLKFSDNIENTFMQAVTNHFGIKPNQTVSDIIENVNKLAPEGELEKFQTIIKYAFDNKMFTDFSITRFVDDVEYKNAAIELYGVAKKQWNIFDMIDKIPHYQSLYKVLSLSYNIDASLSNKYKIIKEIIKNYKYNASKYDKSLSDEDYNAIEEYVDDVLIVQWISDNDISVTIPAGEKYITNEGNLEETQDSMSLDLTTDGGRATFKYWMENSLIPKLKKGIDPVSGKFNSNLQTNKFISAIQYGKRKNKVDNGSIIFRKLPIDMLNINNEFVKEKFEVYEKGLDDLFKINYGNTDYSYGDLFFLYNIMVNKNRFGDDRLTTIFKNSLASNETKSLPQSYMKYLGENDYVGADKFHTFVYEDILIRMAPRIYASQVYEVKKPYVRIFYPETKRFELFKLTQKEVVRRKKSSFMDDMNEFADDFELNDDFSMEESDFDFDGEAKSTFDSGPYVLVEAGTKEQRDLLNSYAIIRTPKFTEKIRSLMLSEEMSDGELSDKLDRLMEKNTVNIKIKCD